MKRVNVANLKNELSRYLRTVRAGEEIVVTSHDHAVARLVPYAKPTALAVRPPSVPMSRVKSLKGVSPLKAVDPVSLLLEDRKRR